MNNFQMCIKVKINSVSELEAFIKKIREIEREHSCHCTHLEVEHI